MDQLLSEGIVQSTETDLAKIKSIIKTEIDKANGVLSNYKRIINYEIRFDEFEKTSTKKIKRMLYK